jgi:hypothetical protein
VVLALCIQILFNGKLIVNSSVQRASELKVQNQNTILILSFGSGLLKAELSMLNGTGFFLNVKLTLESALSYRNITFIIHDLCFKIVRRFKKLAFLDERRFQPKKYLTSLLSKFSIFYGT